MVVSFNFRHYLGGDSMDILSFIITFIVEALREFMSSLIWGIKAIPYVLLAIFLGFFFMWFERFLHARLQRRVGPPPFQPFIDAMKLILKKESVKHGFWNDFGPVFAFGAIVSALLTIPYAGFKFLAFPGDLILALYLLEIPMLGLMLGAAHTANPFAAVGIQRAMLTFLAMQLPAGLVIALFGMHYKTLSIVEIVEAQAVHGWSVFQPDLLVAMIAFIITMLAMFGMKPFDIMIAPGEISMGPFVEFGGKYFGVLHFFMAVSHFAETALFVDLFFGGANGNIFLMIGLQLLVIFILTVTDSVYPRWRIDQALKFMWKVPTGIAALAILIYFIL